jgi:hypothetical protein
MIVLQLVWGRQCLPICAVTGKASATIRWVVSLPDLLSAWLEKSTLKQQLTGL